LQRDGFAESGVTIYRHIKDALLDLDPVLIDTLSGFSIEAVGRGYLVRFKFAFYGPTLNEATLSHGDGAESGAVAQYPDIEVLLDRGVWPKEQIEELSECEIAGQLHAVQIPPGYPGNSSDEPKWIVETHAGSQAERLQWLRSIG
jgi:hypothetical protein